MGRCVGVLLFTALVAVTFFYEASGEKKGVCPLVPRRRKRFCHPDLCQKDENCPGIQKCCFDGCAKACTNPRPPKPGYCPIRALWDRIPCNHDYDCTGNLKCCESLLDCRLFGCEKVCVRPLPYIYDWEDLPYQE